MNRAIGVSHKFENQLDLELKPDIIITDVVSPGMNGIEMIEEPEKSAAPDEIHHFKRLSGFQLCQKSDGHERTRLLVKVPLEESDVIKVLEKAGA